MNDLRLNELRKSWQEIQKTRERIIELRKQRSKIEKENRRLSQLLPKLLNQFNETML